MADATVVQTAAVTSTLISGAVALVSILISTATTRVNAKQQRDLDHKLARERTDAAIKLAERRFDLDVKLADWKRKAEVAEGVLADFYNFRFIIDEVRAVMVLPGEMTPLEGIPDHISARAEYAPVRRLAQFNDFFSDFHAKRNGFAALFGRESLACFDDALRVRQKIYIAVDLLMRLPDWAQINHVEWLKSKNIAFDSHEATDVIRLQVEEIVGRIEKICEVGVLKASKPD